MKKNNILILGYGSTGRDIVNHILKHNIANNIFVSTNDFDKDNQYEQHLKNGVIFLDYNKEIYLNNSFDLIIKSPGIMSHDTMIFNAKKNNIEIISEIEYALNFVKTKNIIAISGSNGKTTLSTLIANMLQNQFPNKVYLCGNIGIPLISLVDEINTDDYIVLELSSFQLNNTKNLKPRVAILTNIDENTHLDWHINFNNYLKAKENIVINQDIDDVFVVNIDNEYLWDMALKTMSSIISFSTKAKLDEQGGYTINNQLWYKEEKIIDLEDCSLVGEHNISNMLGAICVVKQFNVSNESIVSVLKSFNGVEHRLEFVGKFNDIKVYNDSKATNEVSLITALSSMSKPVKLICGGLDRGISFKNLANYDNFVELAFTYGQSKDNFDNSFTNDKISKYDLFEDAVISALNLAKPGDIILLSPGCASWDQFKNFELRGKKFKEIVKKYYNN